MNPRNRHPNADVQEAFDLIKGGMTVAEAAEATGIPKGTISSRVWSARHTPGSALRPPPKQRRGGKRPPPRRRIEDDEPTPQSAPPTDVPAPEEFVLAFVSFVETERRRLTLAEHDLADARALAESLAASNQELHDQLASLQTQLDKARAENAEMAKIVNDKVYNDRRWQDKLGVLGRVVAEPADRVEP